MVKENIYFELNSLRFSSQKKSACRIFQPKPTLEERLISSVEVVIPVSQLTENIVYQTHITRFLRLSTVAIHRYLQSQDWNHQCKDNGPKSNGL